MLPLWFMPFFMQVWLAVRGRGGLFKEPPRPRKINPQRVQKRRKREERKERICPENKEKKRGESVGYCRPEGVLKIDIQWSSAFSKLTGIRRQPSPCLASFVPFLRQKNPSEISKYFRKKESHDYLAIVKLIS